MIRYCCLLFTLALVMPPSHARGQCLAWTPREPLPGLSCQCGAYERTQWAAYDSLRGRILVFTQPYGGTAKLSSWDGESWSTVWEGTNGPSICYESNGMVYDSWRDKLVLRGNVPSCAQLATWEFSCATSLWAEIPETSVPGDPIPALSEPAMVFDSETGVTRLFGWNWNCYCMQQWKWSGTGWTLIPDNSSSIPWREWPSLAYDPDRKRILLFGGLWGQTMADTWEYDVLTNTWVQLPVSGPSARYHHSMVYHAARRTIVLYGGGGSTSAPTALDDTWEWNGASQTWTQLPVTGYGYRGDAAMAYDPARGTIFMYGGYTPYFEYNETSAELGIDSNCDGTIDAVDDCTTSCTRAIARWRTLRAHSGYGELGIVLNAAAAGNGATGPTVETRGVNTNVGVRKIAVDFSGPVALLDPAQISVTYWTTIDPSTISAAQTLTPTNIQMTGPQTLTFDVVGAPAEACFNIALQPGLTTATISGDSDCMLRSLSADGNMDGVVDSADLNLTKDHVGASLIENLQLDYTLSGAINLGDMSYCKSRFTHLVLCPAP